MTELVMLIVVVIMVFAAKRVYERKIEQRLRDNPPQKVMFEVRLPRGVNDANVRMQKFYRKILKLTTTDPKARKQGLGTIDTIYLGEVPHGREAAELRFLVYCAPESLQVLKRTLKQSFGGMAEITTPHGDPIAEIIEGLRPPTPPEGAAAGAAAPEPEQQYLGRADRKAAAQGPETVAAEPLDQPIEFGDEVRPGGSTAPIGDGRIRLPRRSKRRPQAEEDDDGLDIDLS